MPYGLNRGMGVTTYECQAIQESVDPMAAHFSIPCMWAAVFGYSNSEIAVPPAPTGAALTVPPASGEDAAALAQSLSDQQVAAQQALNASGVQSSWWDELTGGAYSAASGAASMTLPWILGAVGVGIFALVAFGGGSARRYGR
jgi:hypothetical protein